MEFHVGWNWVIFTFFCTHWCLAAFHQSLKYHRDAAHNLVPWTSKFWERFFEVTTFLSIGFTYLPSYEYSRIHRMHHAYADNELDPHSPKHLRIRWLVLHYLPFQWLRSLARISGTLVVIDFIEMMWKTSKAFALAADGKMLNGQPIEERFLKNLSRWPQFEQFATSKPVRACWLALYLGVYATFATGYWWLLLPIQIAICPIHGAIINYFGHWAGYRNFDVKDTSTNLGIIVNIHGLPRIINVILNVPFYLFCVSLFGEGWHNNHHDLKDPITNRNFGSTWWELDLTYVIEWTVMHPLNMVDMRKPVILRTTTN